MMVSLPSSSTSMSIAGGVSPGSWLWRTCPVGGSSSSMSFPSCLCGLSGCSSGTSLPERPPIDTSVLDSWASWERL